MGTLSSWLLHLLCPNHYFEYSTFWHKMFQAHPSPSLIHLGLKQYSTEFIRRVCFWKNWRRKKYFIILTKGWSFKPKIITFLYKVEKYRSVWHLKALPQYDTQKSLYVSLCLPGSYCLRSRLDRSLKNICINHKHLSQHIMEKLVTKCIERKISTRWTGKILGILN